MALSHGAPQHKRVPRLRAVQRLVNVALHGCRQSCRLTGQALARARPFIHQMSDKYASLPGGGPSTCSADRWLRDTSLQQQQRTFNAQPVPLPPLACV